VAIHDVALATWPDCQRLLQALRAVADIPLSWLVVPCYRDNAARSPACEAALESLLGQGHELVLHGYTHVDSGPPPAGMLGVQPQRAPALAVAKLTAVQAYQCGHQRPAIPQRPRP
jgi:predicted deacetylase